MKTLSFILIGGSILFCACEGNNRKVTSDMINFSQSASGSQDENAPIISFDSSEFHFGKIAIGEKVSHTFRFTNTGKSALVISQVNPSCGCTTLKDWPEKPIMPGEEGQISVEFNSNGNPGLIDKSVMVATNCFPRDWYLKIKGEVIGTEVEKKQQNSLEMERLK